MYNTCGQNMIRGLNFRLLYRVICVFFFLFFLPSYSGGSSRYDKRRENAQPRKFIREFTEQVPVGGGGNTKQEPTFGKIGQKGNFHTNVRMFAVLMT